MATLRTYWKKRDFGKTAEPRGQAGRKKGFRYVIQKHDATRLHYDLRLELDGVMMSWAVTRGPSLVPGDKRLAIHVEDHPIEYNKFEGTIPEGEYGGGTVMVWDRGTWAPDHDPHKGMQKGHLDFELQGEKLKGHWHLVRMRKRPGERQEPWLLIKATDEVAREKSDPDILEEMPNSAVTGRSLDEIAADKKRVWHSNTSAKEQPMPPELAQDGERAAQPASRGREPRTRTPAAQRAGKKVRQGRGRTRKGRLPAFIPPCLATLSAKARRQTAGWVHEIKFDGYRIQARIGDGKVTLKTRTGLDWTEKFPAVADSLCGAWRPRRHPRRRNRLGRRSGVSDFSALQDDLKNGRQDRMVYYVFDLLHLDGQDLTGAPLIERKRALAALLAELPKDGIVQLSEHFEEDGRRDAQARLQSESRRHRLEARRRALPFRPRRRLAQDQVLEQPGVHRHRLRAIRQANGRLIRSLLLGYYDKDGCATPAGSAPAGARSEERDLATKARRPSRARTRRSTKSRRRSAAREREMGRARNRGRGGFPRLDRRQACSPGLVEGRARGQAGESRWCARSNRCPDRR